MFKLNRFIVFSSLIVIYSFLINTLVFSEEYPGITKIILGKFKSKNGKIIDIPKDVPDWIGSYRGIYRGNIGIDDNDNIYVLNHKNNEILIYDDRGKQVGRINIKHKITEDATFEVSGDGKRFFIIQNSEGYVINRKGKSIKTVKKFYVSDITRKCDGTFVNYYGRRLYDQNLNLVKESQRAGTFLTTDIEGNKYSCLQGQLQYSLIGKIIWEKSLPECLNIIGTDSKGNVYAQIKTSPEGRGDYGFLKMDKNGNKIKSLTIPIHIFDSFSLFSFDDKDREEWELYASEEPIEWDKLTCKGNIYRIYSFWQLPKDALQRWLKGGEYFIYKFEMAK